MFEAGVSELVPHPGLQPVAVDGAAPPSASPNSPVSEHRIRWSGSRESARIEGCPRARWTRTLHGSRQLLDSCRCYRSHSDEVANAPRRTLPSEPARISSKGGAISERTPRGEPPAPVPSTATSCKGQAAMRPGVHAGEVVSAVTVLADDQRSQALINEGRERPLTVLIAVGSSRRRRRPCPMRSVSRSELRPDGRSLDPGFRA